MSKWSTTRQTDSSQPIDGALVFPTARRFHGRPALLRSKHSAGKASNRGRRLRTPSPTERQLRPISQYKSGLSDQGGPDFACMREIDERRPMNANKLRGVQPRFE
jgi:hypothetical protein